MIYKAAYDIIINIILSFISLEIMRIYLHFNANRKMQHKNHRFTIKQYRHINHTRITCIYVYVYLFSKSHLHYCVNI